VGVAHLSSFTYRFRLHENRPWRHLKVFKQRWAQPSFFLSPFPPVPVPPALLPHPLQLDLVAWKRRRREQPGNQIQEKTAEAEKKTSLKNYKNRNNQKSNPCLF
jgi:hypothetical protein